MLYALKEFTLDAWDWIIGRKYPRQELLESLREVRQFPAPPDLKECQSKIGADLKAQTKLTQTSIESDLKAQTKLTQSETKSTQLVLAGMWEREAEKWINTHPDESVTITHHTQSHEEF
jgi:hypothetical protein